MASRSDLRIAMMIFVLAGAGAGRGYADSKESPEDNTPKPRPVGFARDVRPILSDNCFACHGPDDKARKAGLRLDTKEGAFAKLESGGPTIVPGKPDESELIFRIESDDPELHMPPKKSGKQLTADQVAVLRRWVEQGASWSTHWAFEPPQKPALPAVKNAGWPDQRDRPVHPGPARGRGALARARGRQDDADPPRDARPDRPAADPPGGRRVPGRLVRRRPMRRSSTAARLAPLRRAHGAVLARRRPLRRHPRPAPRQLPRDLALPRLGHPRLQRQQAVRPVHRRAAGRRPAAQCRRLDQIIATGFNRCHVSTNEGGSIEEEVYVRNIVDQVDTNGTVFLGLTTGCARCHDHKYDPIRAKDYYQLFAFFNNIDGPALDGNSAKWAPIVQVPTPEASRGAAGRRRPDRRR